MTTRDFQFSAGSETLAGRLQQPDAPSGQSLIFLHGAGQSTKERAQPIADKLADQYAISAFLFDFSGHGESSGSLGTSSISKRTAEARIAIAQSRFQEPLSICAFSMGGHVALELLKTNTIHSLVLFYPAIYSKDAVEVPFSEPRFSDTIRETRSWENNDVLEGLRKFDGNLLIIYGAHDAIIPRDVISMIFDNAHTAGQKRLIMVEDSPHLLLPEVYKRQDLFDEICGAIAQFTQPG